MQQVTSTSFSGLGCRVVKQPLLLFWLFVALHSQAQALRQDAVAELNREAFVSLLATLQSPLARGQERDRAADALVRHGTNALPFLMEELKAVGAIEATNPAAATDRRIQMQAAFEVLGPIARPALPELIAEFRAGRSVGNSAHALIQIGGDQAHRALIEAMTNTNSRIRVAGAAAVRYLKDYPERVKDALAPLLAALQDDSVVLRSVAADTLGILKASPETVLPALVRVAEVDPDSVIRAVAIKSIERFGAVPLFVETRLQKIAATDSDPHVRKMATRAVKGFKEPR